MRTIVATRNKWVVSTILILLSIYSSSAQYYTPVKNAYPIIAWYSIESGYVTPKEFRDLKKTGFNVALTAPLSRSETEEALRIAGKFGIKLIIDCHETRILDKAFIGSVKDSKSLVQYYLSDEPSKVQFSNLREKHREYNKIDSIHHAYINLLPIYASKEQLGVDSYEDYIKKYIETVNPQYVSFDNYPFVRDEFRLDYFENLGVVSRICKEKRLPFWGFIRTLEDSNYWLMDEGRLRFQAYTNIAYGAQGLQYFTYSIPKGCKSAIVDLCHERTNLFYVVANINREIQKQSKFFLGANFAEVIHTDTMNNGSNILSRTINSIKTEGCNAVLSFFEKGGKNYLLVVNKDYENEHSFDIVFNDKASLISKKGIRKPRKQQHHIVIAAGDGALFQIQ